MENKNFMQDLPESIKEELNECVRIYRPKSADEREVTNLNNPAVSVTETTGLIPSGSNQTATEIESYNQIEQLEARPKR